MGGGGRLYVQPKGHPWGGEWPKRSMGSDPLLACTFQNVLAMEENVKIAGNVAMF